jgi:MOSC domain-containing protein YiiM
MRVLSVNISNRKGIPKSPVPEAMLKKDHGLVGDAHAEPGIRQVSLLAKEDYAKLKNAPPEGLRNGIFAENLTTEGIDLPTLPIGTRLKIGEAVLEVSKIGKDCHAGCAIRRQVGDCVMPKRGIFTTVQEEGKIRPGDAIAILEHATSKKKEKV